MIQDGLLSLKLDITAGYLLTVYCPGCKSLHSIGIDHPNNHQAKWDWDGNVDKPTFVPSIRVRMPWLNKDGVEYVCHSFVSQGRWEFLGDSTHALAGTTVDMVNIPDNL